jgi:hypothetical protein
MSITFDGPNKLMILSSGTTTLSVVDLYSRWKDWVLLSDNSKWLEAFAPLGGDDIDQAAGTKVPLYAFLTNNWRVRPQEADHTLSVTSGVLLVQGGGDPFVDTLGDYTVRVNYQQPVQAIGTGSSGITAEDIAAAVWNYSTESATVLTYFRRVFSALFGRTSGVGSSTEAFKSMDGTKDRITMTYDGSGNRQSPTFDDT